MLLLLVLSGCWVDPEFNRRVLPTGDVIGYRPVYHTDPAMQVAFEAPRKLKKPGKIFIYHPYLLVNEQNEGIHFYLNSDPKNPQPLGFLKIKGNTDFVMKGNIVYANNYSDLLSLDVSNRSNIVELSRIAQPSWVSDFPPAGEYSFFECVDPSKGVLLGWEVTTITNPKCYR